MESATNEIPFGVAADSANVKATLGASPTSKVRPTTRSAFEVRALQAVMGFDPRRKRKSCRERVSPAAFPVKIFR